MVWGSGNSLLPTKWLRFGTQYLTSIISAVRHLDLSFITADICINVCNICNNSVNSTSTNNDTTTENTDYTNNSHTNKNNDPTLGSFYVPMFGLSATTSPLTWYPISLSESMHFNIFRAPAERLRDIKQIKLRSCRWNPRRVSSIRSEGY